MMYSLSRSGCFGERTSSVYTCPMENRNELIYTYRHDPRKYITAMIGFDWHQCKRSNTNLCSYCIMIWTLYYIRVELILVNVFKSWNFRNAPPMCDRMQWSSVCTQVLQHSTSTIMCAMVWWCHDVMWQSESHSFQFIASIAVVLVPKYGEHWLG